MSMDIIGVENPVMDFNFLMDKIPNVNHFSELFDYSWQGGGNVSSAIVTASRLGAQCGMVGIVGGDLFGQFCVEEFKRHGVDTTHVYFDRESTTALAVCLAETSTLERTFIGRQGIKRQPSDIEIDKEYLASTKFIHLGQMGEMQVKAAIWAKEMGVTVVDDAGYFNADTEKHVNLIDVFVGSEHYYNGLFCDGNYEENCRLVQKKGPKTVIFTLGKNGCVGMEGDRYFAVPAFQNIPVVDTTGAGDVFHGGFIFGLLQGWDAEKSAIFSSAVSAIKCTRLGGRAGIPDYKTVQTFLETGKIDYSEIDTRVKYYREKIFSMQSI